MNAKTVLVLGASGATGRLLTRELLDRGVRVRAIVRSPDRMIETMGRPVNLSILQASVLDLSAADLTKQVTGCDAVASCLGHNLTLKGIFGQPRRLVTDAARRVCEALSATDCVEPTRYVLMNTTGNRNRDLDESVSVAQSCVISLLRLVLPPHVDNEHAADFLRTELGSNASRIEWVAVRPDSLVNEERVSDYEVHPSPTRSAIFNPGRTSRINVAHFMAELITNDRQWEQWKGQMPVIYNAE